MKKKYALFLAIGMSLVIGQGIISQSVNYEKYIVTPIKFFQNHIVYGEENLRKNEPYIQEQQYKSWLKEDMELIKSLKQQQELPYVKDIEDIYIIMKNESVVLDKLSIKILDKLENLSWMKDNIDEKKAIVTGRENMLYSNIDKAGKEKFNLYLGLKFFQDKNEFTNKIFTIFDKNEQMLFDYVVFHEMGHFLSTKFKDKNNNSQIEMIELINKKIKNNNFSEEEATLIINQYIECIGDVMAVQLMQKKYPHINKNKIKQLAKARMSKDNDNIHFTTLALLAYEKEKNPPNQTLEEMLMTARNKAMISTEFFLENALERKNVNNKINEKKIELKKI